MLLAQCLLHPLPLHCNPGSFGVHQGVPTFEGAKSLTSADNSCRTSTQHVQHPENDINAYVRMHVAVGHGVRWDFVCCAGVCVGAAASVGAPGTAVALDGASCPPGLVV